VEESIKTRISSSGGPSMWHIREPLEKVLPRVLLLDTFLDLIDLIENRQSDIDIG